MLDILKGGKLTKIQIEAYTDSTYEHKVPDLPPFEGLINPTSYNESFNIVYDESPSVGQSATTLKFNRIDPGDFTVDILLDKTGVFNTIESLADAGENIVSNLSDAVPDVIKDAIRDKELDKGVIPDIEALKALLVTYNGTTHQTNAIRVAWAHLIVDCKLTKLEIDYKLFNASGYPIRAEVKLTCRRTTSDASRQGRENATSPDLTHIRYAKAGDTLPLLTYQIYGDAKYYIQVAKVNGLTNFRRLTPGQKIIFPPLA